MRSRLLFSTLAVAVVAVLLLGLPLAIVVRRLILDEARQSLQREAVAIAAGVQYRLGSGQRISADQIAQAYQGRYVVIDLPDHRTQIVVGHRQGGDQLRAEATSSDGAQVAVFRDATEVDEEVLSALLLIGSMALLAIGVAVGLAIVQARRLTLPLLDLAATAQRLGSGQARPRSRRYGISELDRVAEVLDRSAARVAEMLAAEREFATDASHQLRTPLTALSMRLEEMVAAADDPEVVREEGKAALTQTERLAAVIDQLLGRARRGRHGQATPTDIDEVIDQQMEEWEPAFRREGRALHVCGESGLRAVVTPGGFAQVLASLLDNALAHGAGTVTLRIGATPGSVIVEVSDEGPGVPPDLVPRIFERSVSGGSGTGLGLALARALTEADGGRLELVRPRPAVFAVFLRRAADAADEDEAGATADAGDAAAEAAEAGSAGGSAARSRVDEVSGSTDAVGDVGRPA